jgi:hypothetical protein
MSSPYEVLLGLARLEQELVDQRRFGELEALRERWEAVTASLPDPTPEDRKLLEEIELTVWTTVAATRLELEETARLMRLLERGRRAVGSYGGPALKTAVDAKG